MAPQTRSSAPGHNVPATAPSAHTKPTATAIGRRGQSRKKPVRPPPPTPVSSPVKKRAKPGRPSAQRKSRRMRGLSAEFPEGVFTSSKKPQQKQSAAPQQEATLPPKTLKLAPKSNHKLHLQHNELKAPASAPQDPERRNNRHSNDTAEASTGTKQKEPYGSALRHTLGIIPIEIWLQGIEATLPLESTISRSEDTITGYSIRYEELDCREILKRGADGVCLIMDSDDDDFSDDETETEHRLIQESKILLQDLMQMRREGQPDARFHPKAVKSLLDRLHGENKRGIIQELHPVVCPSAGVLRDISFKDKMLRERYDLVVNQWSEPWSNYPSLLPEFCVPLPDYCVGFSWKAFSKDQHDKLNVIADNRTSFKPTTRMHFPFLTCEVTSAFGSLSDTENQNGYSMLIAVRSMVKLFRDARAENTCSGHIMALSMSYNHEMAYIYAYYPIVDGERTVIYRRKVYKSLLKEMEDTTQLYDFFRKLYERWAPHLLSRLREAIDAIDINTASPGTSDSSS